MIILSQLDRREITPIVALPPGALERKLKEQRIKTYAISYPNWIRLRHPLSLIFLLSNALLEPLAMIQLSWIIHRERIDAIYSNSLHVFTGAFCALLWRIKHSWHVREFFQHHSNSMLILPPRVFSHLVKASSQQVLAVSQAVRQQLLSIAIPSQLIKIVHSRALTPATPIDIAANARRSPWVIAIVGRIHPIKGHSLAIQAIHQLQSRGFNIHLHIIGHGELIYELALDEEIKQLQAHGYIIRTGFQDKMSDALKHCALVLAPSSQEPFGRAIIEAMSWGLPVIATISGGPEEIIIDGKTGFLISPGDITALTARISQLYHDPSLVIAMGQASRQRFKERFTAEEKPGIYI